LRCGETSKSEESHILQQPLPQYALHMGQPSWGIAPGTTSSLATSSIL
jgi:hypothetical protein